MKLVLVLLLCLACGPGVSIRGPQPTPATKESRNRAAQSDLESARRQHARGQSDAAARTAERGLEREPSAPELEGQLHLVRAEALHAEGDYAQAAHHRGRAAALLSPPAPLPSEALAAAGAGILVLLLPPEPASRLRQARGPQAEAFTQWPAGLIAQTLLDRLATRLPAAKVELLPGDGHPTAESTRQANDWLGRRASRAVLSLRVDRCSCHVSARDGRFSKVWTRLAGASASEYQPAELWRFVRSSAHASNATDECRREALAYALEELFSGATFATALAAPAGAGPLELSASQLRDLFPALDRNAAETVDSGRVLLASGRLEAARQEFQRALEIDPSDAEALVYLTEVEQMLSIAAQLDQRSGRAATGQLEVALTPAEQEQITRQIREQQRQRDELLAAIAIVEDEPNLPASLDPEQLRPALLDDPASLGSTLARKHAGDTVEARRLYSPAGEVIARYFVTADGELPVLREEDSNGDGHPNRFTGYRDGQRSDVWEDPGGRGRVERHISYAEDGVEIRAVDIDTDGDARFDRRLRYQKGVLVRERRDTTGDGRFDTTDHFDESGELVAREEDRSGDGEIDTRSSYRGGRLVRREILDPSLATDLRRGVNR